MLTADEGEVESDLAHFYYGVTPAATAAIAGGVQMFWSANYLPHWATQGLVGVSAALAATTVLFSLKLFVVVSQWSVSFFKLNAVLYAARVAAGKEPGGQELLSALGNPNAGA